MVYVLLSVDATCCIGDDVTSVRSIDSISFAICVKSVQFCHNFHRFDEPLIEDNVPSIQANIDHKTLNEIKEYVGKKTCPSLCPKKDHGGSGT